MLRIQPVDATHRLNRYTARVSFDNNIYLLTITVECQVKGVIKIETENTLSDMKVSPVAIAK